MQIARSLWVCAGLVLGLVATEPAVAADLLRPLVATGEADQRIDYAGFSNRPTQRVWKPVWAGGHWVERPRVAALTEFQFTADEGDHHIKNLEAGVNVPDAAGVPYYARVGFNHRTNCTNPHFCYDQRPFPWHWRLGLIVPTEDENESYVDDAVVEHCPGSCVVKLSRGRPGYTLLLSGFELKRTGGEAFVRRVTVVAEANGDVRVRFQDNGNPDFRAAVSGVWVASHRIDGAVRNDEVAYVPGKPAPRVEVGNGAFALVGFDLEFKNGDHKLHEIGVRYAAPFLLPKLADKNTDDPWRARVRWVKIAS